ncbi:MAG: mechanosensitive ion channel [Phycisphaerae bacterium]|nr:mechanosensitive ion channel [Phycisphaerae bacterium]
MLTKTFYGNTLWQWAQACLIVLGAVVLGRFLYWLIGKTIKRAASRTRTHLDDILVDMLEEPIVFGVIIAGIWYGLKTLTLPEQADETIDKIAYILFILNIAWLITRVFDAVIREYLIPFATKTESDLDDHLIPIVSKGIKLSVWIIALIMALDNAGFDVLAILGGLGIGGLAFALAAQDSVANFFGSVAIFIDKPFRVGDRVQVEGYDGVVTAVGLRTTKIRTRYEGRIVTIPNQIVAKSDITNVETENGRQVFAVYRLTPDMDDKQIVLAMDLLKSIAQSDPDTMEKVVTGFFAITEYSRDIMLLYWVKPEASNLQTRTRINLEIVRQFQKHNVQLVKANPVHTKWDKVELV